MPCKKKYREHCLDSCQCNFVHCPFRLPYTCIYSINLDIAISENLSILIQSFLDHVTSFSCTFHVLPAF